MARWPMNPTMQRGDGARRNYSVGQEDVADVFTPRRCIAVIGDFGEAGEIAPLLLGLGFEVLPVNLADDPAALLERENGPCVIVIECPGRPKAGAMALSRVRGIPGLSNVGVLFAIDREDALRLQMVSARSFRSSDFIVWPYDLSELRARIAALSLPARLVANEIALGPLRLDLSLREVSIGEEAIELTARESALLFCFLAHPSRVMSRAHLRARVWGKERASLRMVDVYVSRLRAKLGEALPLRTVRGRGYKLQIARSD
jgi:DNA-binding response OmpR family regulator